MRVPATYYPRESPVHRADPRVKLALTLAYTVCLFLACTWRALGVLALLLAVALASSRLPLGTLARTMIPFYALMAFVLALASFGFDPQAKAAAYGVGGVSAGVLEEVPPQLVAGGLYFLPAGFARSLFYCARVAAMLLAGLMVAYSTPATQLTSAVSWFLQPLRPLGVPVDDLAFTCTLVLRFIPLAFEELQEVKAAQAARGASFESGSLWRRVSAWQPVIVPWLVSLYRRAGKIATAMDVRAYGSNRRSTFRPLQARVADRMLLLLGTAAFIAPVLAFS